MKEFCSPESRLFSGDPTTLLGGGCQYVQDVTSLAAGLSSPFDFFIDTEQVPNTQFWNVPYLSVEVYTPLPNNVSNLNNNPFQLYLCPPQMVGTDPNSLATAVASNFNNKNLGIALTIAGFNLLNTAGNRGGILTVSWPFGNALLVPPQWFLRFVLYDQNTGINTVFPNSTITLKYLRQVIPLKFYQLP